MKLVSGGSLSKNKYDDFDIPKNFYPRLGKSVYNPLYIAKRSLSYFKKIENKNDENYIKFLNYANWLKDNLKKYQFNGKVFSVWEYENYFHYYDMHPPWRSGMAQGAGITVMQTAFEMTGDPAFLDSAKYALNAFFVEVKNGGVIYADKKNEWWLEEYAGNNEIKSRVLNGAIYAVIDLYNHWQKTGNENAYFVFKNGLNSIKTNLHKYDTGRWTYYDAIGTIATHHYHNDHIKLAMQLYEITGDELFYQYSKKWENYNIPYFEREFMLQKPDYHDWVILCLTILSFYVFINIALTGLYAIRYILIKNKNI